MTSHDELRDQARATSRNCLTHLIHTVCQNYANECVTIWFTHLDRYVRNFVRHDDDTPWEELTPEPKNIHSEVAKDILRPTNEAFTSDEFKHQYIKEIRKLLFIDCFDFNDNKGSSKPLMYWQTAEYGRRPKDKVQRKGSVLMWAHYVIHNKLRREMGKTERKLLPMKDSMIPGCYHFDAETLMSISKKCTLVSPNERPSKQCTRCKQHRCLPSEQQERLGTNPSQLR